LVKLLKAQPKAILHRSIRRAGTMRSNDWPANSGYFRPFIEAGAQPYRQKQNADRRPNRDRRTLPDFQFTE